MEVEVSVQDCFFGSSPASTDSGIENKLPAHTGFIPAETWEAWFTRWLELLQPLDNLLKEAGPVQGCELTLRLTDNVEVQALNTQYRYLNEPTDVLAFAALEVDCPQPSELSADLPLYLGDIVISVETAQQQAKQQSHPLKTELAWLATHGLLHLLGWDHPDNESLLQMLDQQKKLLQAIGLTVELNES